MTIGSTYPPLVDRFGRRHTSLRVSVTDRCNIRCFYCMPHENVVFKPRHEILTFDEIARFVRAVAQVGITKIRLTGGEPLVRNGLPKLVELLAAINDIQDIALTTNGILLADQARALRDAGLLRVNISLDAMTEATFERISRRKGLEQVFRGIDAARHVGFEQIRLNAVAIRGITEDELLPLARYARDMRLELRFIEFMPLDAEGGWTTDQVLSGRQIREMLEAEFGPLVAADRVDEHQPAVDFHYADGGGSVGFINSVTEPFCGDCNRLRITAEGKVRNCLFSTTEWDARELLRRQASDEQIIALVQDCVAAKKLGHGIDTPEFVRPERAMYQIGG
jgi:cyclic pyranopterin phosphate synthase